MKKAIKNHVAKKATVNPTAAAVPMGFPFIFNSPPRSTTAKPPSPAAMPKQTTTMTPHVQKRMNPSKRPNTGVGAETGGSALFEDNDAPENSIALPVRFTATEICGGTSGTTCKSTIERQPLFNFRGTQLGFAVSSRRSRFQYLKYSCRPRKSGKWNH
jgi:hypothetical protein